MQANDKLARRRFGESTIDPWWTAIQRWVGGCVGGTGLSKKSSGVVFGQALAVKFSTRTARALDRGARLEFGGAVTLDGGNPQRGARPPYRSAPNRANAERRGGPAGRA